MATNTDNMTNNLSNISYADVLSKGKSNNETLNNNPPNSNSDITNGNEATHGVQSQNSATSEGNKNLDLTNTSSSLNDSFEDAEDSQLAFSSSTPKHLNSDLEKSTEEMEDATVSAGTENETLNSNSLEMNEESSDENSDSVEDSDIEDDRNLDNLYPDALKWKFRPSNPALGLPNTVTVLETSYGSKVYLVGTAHFSLESQEDVAKTIRAVQPDSVILELCKSRVNILCMDEATLLEELKGMNLQKIRAVIEQSGFLQGVLHLLFLSMSAHLTKQLGMAPGGEFRRAYHEARQVPGCSVQFGDRPLQITLQRALAKLSTWQKIKIAWHMLGNKEPISKEDVERCKQKDLLEEMLAEMTGEFPELSHVFVKERDTFLTYSLQVASLPLLSPHSKTPTPSTVVGVVGIGHVPGIKEKWGKVRDEDIPPLMCVPEPTLSSKVFRQTVRLSVLTLGLYGLYKLMPKSLLVKPKFLNF